MAIVTGSSSGVGRAIALALASEGAHVVCSDLRPDLRPGGYETETAPTHEVISRQGKSIFKKADASSPQDVEGLVAAAVEEWGRLDMWDGCQLARRSMLMISKYGQQRRHILWAKSYCGRICGSVRQDDGRSDCVGL